MSQPLQHLAWLLSSLAIRIMRARIVVDLSLSSLDDNAYYIIAANHQNLFDPFMISGALPFPVWRRLTPMRYFTQNGVLRNRISRMFLFALGCFPAYQNERHQYGLPYGIDALNNGHSTFIFPEGRRTLARLSAKGGVSVLASQPGTRIIPACIEWHKSWHGPSFSLHIGHPFDGSSLTAEDILDHIYQLRLDR